MITQELINYIKEQLGAGVAKEKIVQDLSIGGGWELQSIEEAFNTTSPLHTPTTSGAILNKSSQTPSSIKYFEWLMYGSFLASAIFGTFQFVSMDYAPYLLTTMAVSIIGMLIKLICVHRIVYRQSEWARIVLTILFAFTIFSIFGIVFYVFINPMLLFSLVPVVLEIFALYFLFTKSSTEWLTANSIGSSNVNSNYVTDNKQWSQAIPVLNGIALVASIALLAIVDIPILISEPSLAPFFYAMLFVLVVSSAFYVYEQFTLKKLFRNNTSRLDTWFVALTVLRNIVFVLNFIPGIQILGGIGFVFGGIPYLTGYYFLLRSRKKSIVSST